jgi:hypothetical protein
MAFGTDNIIPLLLVLTQELKYVSAQKKNFSDAQKKKFSENC